jgi:hypothetical protein
MNSAFPLMQWSSINSNVVPIKSVNCHKFIKFQYFSSLICCTKELDNIEHIFKFVQYIFLFVWDIISTQFYF